MLIVDAYLSIKVYIGIPIRYISNPWLIQLPHTDPPWARMELEAAQVWTSSTWQWGYSSSIFLGV